MYPKILSSIDNLTTEVNGHTSVAVPNTVEQVDLVGMVNEINNEVSVLNNETSVLNNEVSTLNNETSVLSTSLSSGIILNPVLAYGMNGKITNTGKDSAFPVVTYIGQSYTNLLGKDGNCEDVSKWNTSGTLALDSGNKVFGSNGIRLTLTSTYGAMFNPIAKYNIDITKYYLMTAYVKNINASNIFFRKDNNGGGNNISTTLVTDTTKFTQVGIVVSPSDFNTSNSISISVNGSITNSAVVDGIMVTQITSAEYALGVTAMLAKYPYVDSYACLQNPYTEIRHDNLVRNGNCEEGIGWWSLPQTTATSLSINVIGGSFQFIMTGTGVGFMTQWVNVKPNTNYYLSATLGTGVQLEVNDSTNSIAIKSLGGVGYFNSGTSSKVLIYVLVSTAGTFTVNNIMLTEGTVAPVTYLPFRQERQIIEGVFTTDDSVITQGGKIIGGQRNWKHSILFGKDYDWQYYFDYVGNKVIKLAQSQLSGLQLSSVGAGLAQLIKYDGKVPLQVGILADSYADKYTVFADNFLYLGIADSDTGWAETIAPNNDEVKAFMNGWRAYATYGSRYVNWKSVIDGSRPSIQIWSTITTQSGTSYTIPDASIFKVADTLQIYSSVGAAMGLTTITGIAGNVITCDGTINGTTGGTMEKIGIGTSDLTLLNYCKNNVAPGYEGYKLHYKLANPEILTDDNTHIHGDIPKLDVGDNYVYLDSGIVLGEVSSPQFSALANRYRANFMLSNTPDISSISLLKNNINNFNAIYKNGQYDNTEWMIFNTGDLGNPNTNASGCFQSSSTGATAIDANATYTVDYKILATQAPQIGSIACSYSQDVFTAIQKNTEAIEGRQQHDSALDTLTDLSMYEKVIFNYVYAPYYYVNGTLYIQACIPLMPKKTIPVFTISTKILVGGTSGDIDVTTKFGFASAALKGSSLQILFSTADTTTIANVKTNGAEFSNLTVITDCRGRV